MTGKQWLESALIEYEGALMRYAYSMLQDTESARDAVQETFVKLLENGPDSVRDHLAPWLFKVCRNHIIDRQRKEARVEPISPEMSAKLHDGNDGPETGTARGQLTRKAVALLQDLPNNQREVIYLKYQNGLSYKEISRVTQLSVTNVGYLMHTGLKAVRRSMNDDMGPQIAQGGVS